MSKEATLISDESELAAEILDLKSLQRHQTEKLEMVNVCQICLETYDNVKRPKIGIRKGYWFFSFKINYFILSYLIINILSSLCGHVFCSNCIENLINTSPFAVTGTAVCPTCQIHFSRHQIFKVIHDS